MPWPTRPCSMWLSLLHWFPLWSPLAYHDSLPSKTWVSAILQHTRRLPAPALPKAVSSPCNTFFYRATWITPLPQSSLLKCTFLAKSTLTNALNIVPLPVWLIVLTLFYFFPHYLPSSNILNSFTECIYFLSSSKGKFFESRDFGFFYSLSFSQV